MTTALSIAYIVGRILCRKHFRVLSTHKEMTDRSSRTLRYHRSREGESFGLSTQKDSDIYKSTQTGT